MLAMYEKKKQPRLDVTMGLGVWLLDASGERVFAVWEGTVGSLHDVVCKLEQVAKT